MSDPAETEKVFGADLHPILPFGWSALTVIALYPGAQLQAHRDLHLTAARVHIPLLLNDQCWVFSDGDWQQLTEGQAYVMDPTRWHGAVNWGPTRRLHLIVDRA